MGRGNKYYSKEKERYREAITNLHKKYTGKINLLKEIHGAEAAMQYVDDCDNATKLAKNCQSPKRHSKLLDELDKEPKKDKYYPIKNKEKENAETNAKGRMICDILNSNKEKKLQKISNLNQDSIKSILTDDEFIQFQNGKRDFGDLIIFQQQ